MYIYFCTFTNGYSLLDSRVIFFNSQSSGCLAISQQIIKNFAVKKVFIGKTFQQFLGYIWCPYISELCDTDTQSCYLGLIIYAFIWDLHQRIKKNRILFFLFIIVVRTIISKKKHKYFLNKWCLLGPKVSFNFSNPEW